MRERLLVASESIKPCLCGPVAPSINTSGASLTNGDVTNKLKNEDRGSI